MPLKGIIWTEADITDTTDGWYKRFVSGPFDDPGDWATRSPDDVARIESNKNAWASNKAADRYTRYFKGSINTTVPQDQSGIYDPLTAGEKMRDAAFYYLVMSFSPTPSVVTSANAGKRSVIDEILNQIVDATYSYGGATIKAFDFAGTPIRWKLGGGSDVNPYFQIFGEWLITVLYAWDFVKDQATDTEMSKFNTWIKAGGRVGRSTYERTEVEATSIKRGMDEFFVSRTGTPGTYTIASSWADEELSGIDSKGKQSKYLHSGYKRTHKIGRFLSNRHRVEAMGTGIIGSYLGYQPFIDSADRVFKEIMAYAMYPDLSYTDFSRSSDLDPTTGEVKASKGYSYSIPVPLVTYAYIRALAGDTSLFTYETTLGTTTAQSGTNGNSSDGVAVKGLLRFMKLLNQMHSGTVNRYSPVDGTSRIGAIDISGKENCQYWSYHIANLYYQDSTLYSFINRTIPSSRQPNGPSSEWNVGNIPAIFLMFAGYGNVPARNRFVSEDPDPDIPKTPQVITVQPIPSREYVPGDSFTVTATAPGGTVVNTKVSGPATMVGNVVTITGAGTIALKSTQAGDATYLPAEDVFTNVVVRKAAQVLSLNAIPDQVMPGSVDVVFASSSGLTPVATGNEFLSKTDADTFAFVGPGLAEVIVNQAGNANYEAAVPVSRKFTIAPVAEPTGNGLLLTEGVDENGDTYPDQPTQSVERLTSGGKPFYRFKTLWPEFGTPKYLSSLLMKTGQQTGKPVFNNRLTNYKFYVRLSGAAAEDWMLWCYEDLTQQNDIERGITINDVIQVKRESDGSDPKRKVQSTTVYGHEAE